MPSSEVVFSTDLTAVSTYLDRDLAGLKREDGSNSFGAGDGEGRSLRYYHVLAFLLLEREKITFHASASTISANLQYFTSHTSSCHCLEAHELQRGKMFLNVFLTITSCRAYPPDVIT